MRYTFDFYILVDPVNMSGSSKWTRIATDTLATAVTRQIAEAKSRGISWYVDVTDGLRNSTIAYVDEDKFDEFCETASRDVWKDSGTKAEERAAIRRNLEERRAFGWKPFDEEETGIHMKEGGVTRDGDKKLDGLAIRLSAGDNNLGSILRERLDKPLVDSNVKTAAAIGKPTMSYVPPAAFFAIGAAMEFGAVTKGYGRYNWRQTGTTASVFYDAMNRHLQDWFSGEDYASDSGLHHLAHLMAGAAIILDSIATERMKDDRQPLGLSRKASDKTNWSNG
jgi:hypothetical protein